MGRNFAYVGLIIAGLCGVLWYVALFSAGPNPDTAANSSLAFAQLLWIGALAGLGLAAIGGALMLFGRKQRPVI